LTSKHARSKTTSLIAQKFVQTKFEMGLVKKTLVVPYILRLVANTSSVSSATERFALPKFHL
jgi:hypothetical protein